MEADFSIVLPMGWNFHHTVSAFRACDAGLGPPFPSHFYQKTRVVAVFARRAFTA